jgi:cytochrome bd-type quinol oxidase subunit 2
MSTSPTAPAGWYDNAGKTQYWDGQQWLEAQPRREDAANPYQKFLLGAAIIAVAIGVILAFFANGMVSTASVYNSDPTTAYGWMWAGALLIVAGVVCFLMWIGARARR